MLVRQMLARHRSNWNHPKPLNVMDRYFIEFDGEYKSLVAFTSLLAIALLLATNSFSAAESNLAIVGAGVEQAEDSPFVGSDYDFLPGDFLFFTFGVSGFGIDSAQSGDVRKIALTYEATPEDSSGKPLTPPDRGEIKEDLHPEDKNWLPKRHASFLIPSFVAAGTYNVHVTVKDAISKSETSADFPFRIGGVQIKESPSITAENFRFLRTEDGREPLRIPAYSPGDDVYARFDMTGYKIGVDKQYHIAYGLTVLGPDGKPFIQQPQAAELQSGGFYPPQFVPGNLDLKTSRDSATGEYVVVLTVRDLLSNQTSELKRAFSLEQ